MVKKSLAVQIMTALVLLIGAYAGFFSSGIQAWLGIASMALTLTLSTVFPSGTLPTHWTTVMWITNISGIVLQVLTVIGEQGLVDAQTINIVMIAINVILQTIVKQYDTEQTT